MKPEVKTLFDKACDALKVSPETRDTRWRLLSDLNLSPHDEVIISLVASGKMEELAAHMRATASVIDTIPEKVEAAAKRAVGPVATAAAKQVEAVQAKATADLGPAIAAAALQGSRHRTGTKPR